MATDNPKWNLIPKLVKSTSKKWKQRRRSTAAVGDKERPPRDNGFLTRRKSRSSFSQSLKNEEEDDFDIEGSTSQIERDANTVARLDLLEESIRTASSKKEDATTDRRKSLLRAPSNTDLEALQEEEEATKPNERPRSRSPPKTTSSITMNVKLSPVKTHIQQFDPMRSPMEETPVTAPTSASDTSWSLGVPVPFTDSSNSSTRSSRTSFRSISDSSKQEAVTTQNKSRSVPLSYMVSPGRQLARRRDDDMSLPSHLSECMHSVVTQKVNNLEHGTMWHKRPNDDSREPTIRTRNRTPSPTRSQEWVQNQRKGDQSKEKNTRTSSRSPTRTHEPAARMRSRTPSPTLQARSEAVTRNQRSEDPSKELTSRTRNRTPSPTQRSRSEAIMRNQTSEDKSKETTLRTRNRTPSPTQRAVTRNQRSEDRSKELTIRTRIRTPSPTQRAKSEAMARSVSPSSRAIDAAGVITSSPLGRKQATRRTLGSKSSSQPALGDIRSRLLGDAKSRASARSMTANDRSRKHTKTPSPVRSVSSRDRKSAPKKHSSIPSRYDSKPQGSTHSRGALDRKSTPKKHNSTPSRSRPLSRQNDAGTRGSTHSRGSQDLSPVGRKRRTVSKRKTSSTRSRSPNERSLVSTHSRSSQDLSPPRSPLGKGKDARRTMRGLSPTNVNGRASSQHRDPASSDGPTRVLSKAARSSSRSRVPTASRTYTRSRSRSHSKDRSGTEVTTTTGAERRKETRSRSRSRDKSGSNSTQGVPPRRQVSSEWKSPLAGEAVPKTPSRSKRQSSQLRNRKTSKPSGSSNDRPGKTKSDQRTIGLTRSSSEPTGLDAETSLQSGSTPSKALNFDSSISSAATAPKTLNFDASLQSTGTSTPDRKKLRKVPSMDYDVDRKPRTPTGKAKRTSTKSQEGKKESSASKARPAGEALAFEGEIQLNDLAMAEGIPVGLPLTADISERTSSSRKTRSMKSQRNPGNNRKTVRSSLRKQLDGHLDGSSSKVSSQRTLNTAPADFSNSFGSSSGKLQSESPRSTGQRRKVKEAPKVSGIEELEAYLSSPPRIPRGAAK